MEPQVVAPVAQAVPVVLVDRSRLPSRPPAVPVVRVVWLQEGLWLGQLELVGVP